MPPVILVYLRVCGQFSWCPILSGAGYLACLPETLVLRRLTFTCEENTALPGTVRHS